jgi:3-deoxy-D-arabino-heptulosonate 7-phosphate (DAHP) synthase class II
MNEGTRQIWDSLRYALKHSKNYDEFADLMQGETEFYLTCPEKNRVGQTVHVEINGAEITECCGDYTTVTFNGRSYVVPTGCIIKEEKL